MALITPKVMSIILLAPTKKMLEEEKWNLVECFSLHILVFGIIKKVWDSLRVCLSELEVYEFNDKREFYLYVRSLCLRCLDSRNGLCLLGELAGSHILTKKVSSQMEVWHISSRVLNDAVYPKNWWSRVDTQPFSRGKSHSANNNIWRWPSLAHPW